MLKIIKYLKPYLVSILLIFALLFVQAMTDLQLPTYMSEIINVGIQQNGIEDATPEVIRQSQLDKLKLLMSDDGQAAVEEIYTVVEPSDESQADYLALVEQYPLLESESLAVLSVDRNKIPEAAKSALTQAMAVSAALLSGNYVDTAFIPEGMDFFDMLAMMEDTQRQLMLEQIDQRLGGLTDSILNQLAVTAVKAEYDVIGVEIPAIQNSFMFRTGGLMLLIALLGAACSILVGLLGSRVAAGYARDLRRRVFTRVENFSNAEFDTFSTASLITRSTNDIQQIQMTLVLILRIMFYAPILGVGGILKVVDSNSSMTWIIAIAVAAMMTLILTLFIIATPRFKIIQKLVDRLNLVTREILSGLMVIRAFNTQDRQGEKFDRANTDITRNNLFVSRVMAVMMPSMMLIMNGVSILIIWVGSHQVDMGSMQVGDVMAFIQYTMQIIMAFLMTSMVFIMLPRASVSANRVAEVLAVRPTILDPKSPLEFPGRAAGKIEFRDVSFKYPGADDPVLCNISFTAQPGQTTAFIGSTGCGKSTLVNLIPRFHEVSEGQVLVDDIDIRDVRQKDLRQRIGYVSQKGTLFSGDIDSNIRYGKPDAGDEEIREAAATAQAAEFIDASEDGYQTPIAQGGTNVSGGQKQRLSIARALVRKAPIYIFDDTFSALDFKTDAALRKALSQQTDASTVLIVAQRIGTILNADQIVVLDEGRIVGIGKHADLLKSCPVYLEIASSQLSEEELAI